eukprot:748811-Hanusia_phi.AAC.2
MPSGSVRSVHPDRPCSCPVPILPVSPRPRPLCVPPFSSSRILEASSLPHPLRDPNTLPTSKVAA